MFSNENEFSQEFGKYLNCFSDLPTLTSPPSEFVSEIRRTLNNCEPNLPEERQDQVRTTI